MKNKSERTFGSIIKEARADAGLSMREAAEDARISKSLLRFWELDQVEAPDLGKVLRLAATLSIEPLELCEAAGYDISGALPTVQPYFRSKYPNLPEAALRQITAITEKYGIDPNHTSPRPGEDEK